MYADSKDLAKRTVSGKVFKDRAYEIALNPKFDGYQRGLVSMVHRFEGFIRTLKGKINKKLIANNRNDPSYFDYLNKLLDDCSNTYHRFIGKSPFHSD